MIQAKDIIFRLNSHTKLTYILIGGVVMGTLKKFKVYNKHDKPFTVSYCTMDGDGLPMNVHFYFGNRKQAIDHIVKALTRKNRRHIDISLGENKGNEKI